ncbi:MAG: murein L,D-transpeptidase family protein [Hyphomicrobiaceae bacterium]|nr:murein L,D-transpeptidase family protein [Hyphomicrobiaceae bacterium]
MTQLLRAALAAAMALGLAACAGAPQIPPAEQPLSKDALMMLGRKGMDARAPIFVRIFKEESELEVWKARDDGRFYHFKTYPICNWSGDLGPKLQQGDKQAPEGFYSVSRTQMNPNSSFHVAFNLGYPNAYDKAYGRTGDFLMVHGKCRSAGCYAMTDGLMEEIYALAREAFEGGQERFEVHAFPFRMTDANMARHAKHQWIGFWRTLKDGYDHFEAHRMPPQVAVCERKYVVNVAMGPHERVDPLGRCPRFLRPSIEPFVPRPTEQQIAEERLTVPGAKTRSLASIPSSVIASGLPVGGYDGTQAMAGLGGPGGSGILSSSASALTADAALVPPSPVPALGFAR